MSSKKPLNYQTLSAELDQLLEKLQSGDLDIDEAIATYERGQTIVAQLETYLKAAENKVTKLKTKLDADS